MLGYNTITEIHCRDQFKHVVSFCLIGLCKCQALNKIHHIEIFFFKTNLNTFSPVIYAITTFLYFSYTFCNCNFKNQLRHWSSLLLIKTLLILINFAFSQLFSIDIQVSLLRAAITLLCSCRSLNIAFAILASLFLHVSQLKFW